MNEYFICIAILKATFGSMPLIQSSDITIPAMPYSPSMLETVWIREIKLRIVAEAGARTDHL